MTDKHPPAPWTIERHAGFKIMDVNGEFVAKVPIFKNDDAAWHRAKLLAAAPDLLAACVQAYGDLIEGREVDIEKLDRAIAKAEGRS